MKTMTVGEFKSQFSQVLEEIKRGGKIAITFGRKKEIVGYFASEIPQKPKRNLGILKDKAKVVFNEDFKIPEDDFLSL